MRFQNAGQTRGENLSTSPSQWQHVISSEGLIAFAREHGITHLAVGRPARRYGYRWFSHSVLEVLMRELTGVHILVV